MQRKRLMVLGTLAVVTLATAGALARYTLHLREGVAKTKADLEALERGLAQFKFVKSRYPTVDEGLAASVKAWAVLQCAQTTAPQACIDQPREVPKDAWGNAFRYRSDGPNHALVTSAGPDGEFDTHDDLHLVSKGGAQASQ
jgi:general secretion pathway protein G